MEDFLTKFSRAFGKKEALLLKLTGLTEAEAEGSGCWITGSNGNKWLDFGSFGVHLLGHRHPEVVETAVAQLRRMGLSTRILGNGAATACARALLSTMPASMNRVVFANSGAESVEIAVKTALLFTGKREFLALKYSFHGKTIGANSLTYSERSHQGPALPGFKTHFVEAGDLAGAEKILATGHIAGTIVEPVQGEGGIVGIPGDFIRKLQNLCHNHGSLFILDEIQTGLGRCGKLWYGVDDDVCPDILLTGKTLGGGIVPIAAAVFSETINKERCTDPLLNASSFAGGAFACRIAQKVIEIVSREDFLRDVHLKGSYCKTFLQERLGGNRRVAAVRGYGLMLGIEFHDGSFTSEVIMEAIKKRLLLTFCLVRKNVLRFYPPAVTSQRDLEWGLTEIVRVVEDLSKQDL